MLGFAAGAQAQTVSISAHDNANEGNSGTTDKYFTVSLSSTVSTEFIIEICITGGTATKSATAAWAAGADYRFLIGPNPRTDTCDTISLGGGGGTSSNSVGIQVRGDTDAESDETVIATITLGNNVPNGVTLGTATATYTILDDDTPSDTTAPQITSITRQTPSTSPTNADTLKWQVTFDEAVQNVDATDFSVDGTTATLTVSRVGSTHAYDITATGGNLADRNTIVTLGFANGHNIQDTSGNALTDTSPTGGGANDNTYEVDNLKPRVRSFTRQNPTTESTSADTLTWRVTFNEAVKNVNGADFIIYGTTATITSVTPVTGNEQTTYDLTVTGGNLAGLNGTVRLGFNTGGHNIHDIAGNKLTNYGRTSTSHNTFEVSNTAPNTAPTVANLIPNQTATVGGAFSYAVPADTFNDADGDSLTYSATQSDNSALPSWLSFIAGTRTFSGTPQSTDTGTVSVKVTANDGNSGTVSDTFDIVVSAAPTPTVTVTGLTSVTEGNDAIFTLAFSPQLTTNLTVNFTSSASGDFFSANSLTVASLIVPSGNSSWRFRPTMLDDSLDEPDGSITVTVNTGTGYTPGNPSSATIIVKDDDPTVVSLARVDSGALNEGDTAEFTVTLGRALVAGEMIDVPLIISGTNVTTADWSLATKTGASNTGITLQNINTATPKVRFAGLDAQIATLELTATADSTTESTETFTLALGTNTAFDANALGTNVGGGADPHSTNNNFNVTVNNVVPPVNAPTVDFDSATSSALEDAGTHTVTVNLSSAAPAGGLTLSYNVTGTATAGSGNDFTIQNSGTVAVAAGATMATIPVVINDDSTDENAETVILTLTGGTGYTLGSTDVHTLTITDNDNPPPGTPELVISKNTLSVTEAGTSSYTVRLATEPMGTVTVNITITSDNGDVTVSPASLTFHASGGSKPWNTAQTVTVSAGQDTADEDSVTLIHTASGGGYDSVTTASVPVTVGDDEATPTTPPTTPTALTPVVSISAGVPSVTEGDAISFTLSATPPPKAGTTIAVTVNIAEDGSVAASGQTGGRQVAISASGMASFTVATDDDTIYEETDGSITATVQAGAGYRPHSSNASAAVSVKDNDPALELSTGHLRVSKGGSISYTIALATQPSDPVRVSISGHEATGLTVDVASLDFTPANWNVPQEVTLTAPGKAASITLTHTATGGNYGGVEAEVVVTVIALDPKARQGWLSRFGRTVSHQVVEGIQGRFAAPPSPPGLHLTVAGEALSSTTPLAENQQVLSKALGFETVTTHQLVEGSSFSFAPSADGAPAQFAIWGQGALASFSGAEDSLSLDGDVSTALLGAEWSAARWRAGAALSHSWGSGGYAEDNTVAGGDISSSILTGIFPYGRYRLTPRLGIWAVAGYGWGDLTLKPDGDDADYSPGTTMTMGAVGVDGLLLDGGAEGLSLTTTADALLVQTTSEAVANLASSDANISRLRLGLEATRPVLLANGASLLPSLELGIRQDRGDAETGFGMELGAGLAWTDPERGISADLKGHTLLTHTEEEFREQGLAVSFAWEPNPSNRGPSFSVSHAVGAAAEGGMDALLSPTAMETLDVTPSRYHQFETKLAYGFPAFNDRLTLTPGMGWALSPDSRTYSLLWALAPYTQQPQAEPWEISLEGERQEDNAGESAAEHSLKLRFSLPF